MIDTFYPDKNKKQYYPGKLIKTTPFFPEKTMAKRCVIK